MTDPSAVSLEEMRRVPGLFRRWELPGVFEPHRRYHLEEAGSHADGTPLIALYVGDLDEATEPSDKSDSSPCLLVTESDLKIWLAGAQGGQTLEYHRGVLAIDRLTVGSRLPKEGARGLDRVATAAMAAATSGRAHLVQKRHADGSFSYLIVAHSQPGKRP